VLWWIGLRLVALTAERVGLRRLGAGQSPWAVMVVAYGGAALCLWGVAATQGDLRWRASAMLPALTYWAAFSAYTLALVEGPLSVVSPWANATVPLLFLLHPSGGPVALAGLALFGAGTWLNLQGGRIGRGVWYMWAADVALAVARLQDATAATSPYSYGATLYTVVSLGMMGLNGLLRQGGLRTALALLHRRQAWAMVTLLANAGSYLTLLLLLAHLAPGAVEATSGGASFLAALLGVMWLKEPSGWRALGGAALMALGATLVLYDHTAGFGVQ